MNYRWLGLMLLAGSVAACGGAGNGGGSANGDFVSDNPNHYGDSGAGESGGDGDAAGGDDGGGAAPGDDSGMGEGGGDDPNREIAEADIVHIDGDRLYALSQFGGLAVIDVADPDNMRILGRYRAHGMPFEMYVDAGQVFVMYSDFGFWSWDEDGYGWRTTSKLIALDASDPTAIRNRGEYDLPGQIQDSRRVGDVLYLVTHENGYCWGCQTDPNTAVTSVDVSDPTDVEQIDQLRFVTNEQDGGWGWSGQRSVSTTDERLYVAGMEFSDNWEDAHSIIDVVDISDPGGDLEKGASISVAGQITSRWQMDEFEGVLRVVSQPGTWGGTNPPVIETFSVASASNISPLGSTTMNLPRPESLRSVRFDGHRGYAITFEQTDPLFTLDLSDPSQPRQVGELEIPGWVHHMEPRGDRVLGLGFDPTNEDGALNVSLFDVSDFEAPQMISRVHFGGDWASFAEDQNRIHKSFAILEELGLLLVPFSGWEYDTGDDYGCWGRYQSGVQLVDWSDDTLGLRGVAPAHGRARRALIHKDRMIAMSDKSVETFDIGDRDAPLKTDDLPLAKSVSQVGFGDGMVVKLSQDWWTEHVSLEIGAEADAESPDSIGSIDLNEVLEGDNGVEGCWYWGLYNSEIVVNGSYAYLVREQYNYGDDYGYYGYNSTTLLDVFDLSDPAAPTYVQTVDLEMPLGWAGNAFVRVDEQRLLRVGNSLVISGNGGRWIEDEWTTESSVKFVDLTDPAAPVVRKTIDRQEGLAHGRLQAYGDTVVSWHMKSANNNASKVRFYLDRFDVSNPAAPQVEKPVNVPGVVAGYDTDSERAVTVDFQLQAIQATSDQCYQQAKVHNYDWETNRCMLAHRDIKVVELEGDKARLLSVADVEGDEGSLRSIAVSDSHIFAHVMEGTWWWDEQAGLEQVPSDSIAVLDHWADSGMRLQSKTQVGHGGWWLGVLRAVGDSVVFHLDGGLAVLDAEKSDQPEVEMHELYGWGCWDVDIHDGKAVCATGEWGLQLVSVD